LGHDEDGAVARIFNWWRFFRSSGDFSKEVIYIPTIHCTSCINLLFHRQILIRLMNFDGWRAKSTDYIYMRESSLQRAPATIPYFRFQIEVCQEPKHILNFMRGRTCKMHQTHVLNSFLLFCAIFSHPARASPVNPRNSTQQWTFAEVCAYPVVSRVLLTKSIRSPHRRNWETGTLALMTSCVRFLMCVGNYSSFLIQN
jgi:hypothetical protein